MSKMMVNLDGSFVNQRFFLGLIFTFLLIALVATFSYGYSKVLLDYLSPYGSIISLTSGDFDSDGKGEVAFLSGNQLKLYAVNREGTLFFISDAFSGNQPLDVEKVDVNGDGTYDVVASSDKVISAFNIKSGSSAPYYSITAPSPIFFRTTLKLGDPNGDLATDIIIGGYFSTRNRSRIYVYRANNGVATYDTPFFGGVVSGIGVKDVDNDGYDDVVAGLSDGKIYLFRGGSTGFTTAWNVTDGSQRNIGKIDFIPDRNGDGWKEIVVGTAGQKAGVSDAVVVLSGRDGSQLASYTVAGMGAVTSLKITDLDGDGAPEIVLGSGRYRNLSGTLVADNRTRILSSTLPLTLKAQTGILSADNFLSVSDFDGDGFSEIAVSHSNLVNVYSFDGSNLQLEEEVTVGTGNVSSEEQLDVCRFNEGDEVSDLVRGAISGEIKVITFYERPLPSAPKLMVSNVPVGDKKVYPGDKDLLIDVYKLVPEKDTTLTSIRIKKTGNVPDSLFKNLRLYKDDGSGSFELTDEIVSTATLAGGYADFNISLPLSAGTTTTLFFVLDLEEVLPLGESFFYSIDASSDVVAGSLESTGSFPLVSARFTIYDRTTPITIIEKNVPLPNGNNGWYRSALKIHFSSNKPGITYYWIDEGPPKVYTAPISFPQGLHTVYYYSVDLYGNRETTKSEIIKLDSLPPEIPHGVVASAKSPSSVQVRWRASLDKQPGSGLAIYKIYRNGSLAGIVPSSETSFLDSGLDSGREYRYRVVAEDAAGNHSGMSNEVVCQTPNKPVSIEGLRVVSSFDRNLITWARIEATEVATIDIERSDPESGTTGWRKINATGLPPETTFFEDLLSPEEMKHLYYYRLVLKDSQGKVVAISRPAKPTSVKVSKLITSSGGAVLPTTGEIEIKIPAGAISNDTVITIDSVSATLPPGKVSLSKIYDFGPDGLSFSKPATLTISINAPLRGVDKSLISIGQFSNGSWSFLPTQVDTTKGTATCLINHFSLFGVFFFGSELDTTPPVISAVRSASPNRVFVTFSEFMDTTSLLTLSNYTITEATVTSAIPFPDGKSVILQTTYMRPLTEHTITVVNVKDLAGNTIVNDGIGNVATFAVASEPHGKYLDDTNKCSLCHKVHQAKTPKLLVKQSATEVCYLCHDEVGSGSKYNTKASFDSTTSVSIHRSRKGDSNVYCTDCHSPHKDPVVIPRLLRIRSENTTTPLGEAFCYSCHAPGKGLPEYQQVNEASYTASSHHTKLPGPSSGTGITCMHCHQSHSSPLLSLLRGNVEEYTCVSCHREIGTSPESGASISARDIYSCLINSPEATVGLPGFEATRTVWYKHPVLEISGKHTLMELFDSTEAAEIQNSPQSRHAECSDCHNPHHAQMTTTRTAPVAPQSLIGISGVQVIYTTDTTIPNYSFIPYNVGITYQYELCFKCHSSFAKSAYGSDLAAVMSPNNASYHPVVSIGKNQTSYMANNLLPPYTTTSQIYCTDCHSCSDTTGPLGPHGSQFPFILKANYRFELKETTTSDDFNLNDFALCFNCHRSAPYEDATGQQRSDSNFRFHGYHLRRLYNDPAGGLSGGILTPGAGKGNAICRECHYNPHGSGNERLVNFAPNVLGPNGEIGGATWTKKTDTTPGACNLKCHGKVHNPLTY